MRPFVQEPTKDWSIRTSPIWLMPTTLAGECGRGAGGHFDATLLGATISRPEFLDEATVRGELLLTTWHFRDLPVVKYEVGDVVEVTTRPCGCGEASPRLTFVERTHEGFVLAGLKLRHQTVVEALRRVAGDLDGITITLGDLPESEGHTLMRIGLRERFAPREQELLDVLKYRIFELDDLYHFGLVRFRLDFLADGAFDRRKVRRVTDRRRCPGDDPGDDGAGPGKGRSPGGA